MSTNITQATPSPIAVELERESCLSFQELKKMLDGLRVAPTLADLDRWLSEARVSVEDLCPFRFFKPGTYTRHRVLRNEFVELLVLCWLPGQRTPIHDHNGSYGAVRVCEGVMWETTFALNDARELYYRSAREWSKGAVTGADVPDIHQIGNPECSGQSLVTLHLYAPPLGVLNTYKVGSSEVGHYSPNEFMDGAGI
ncbi:MAG TPA: cysteine dioxygenase family protein [Pyrinomonadaceae bacterium]|jgi:cysteine dioxygenase|nr:cysteine dioxygenase family protein [Pyrinomonadaceae bacterium]